MKEASSGWRLHYVLKAVHSMCSAIGRRNLSSMSPAIKGF
ncbi:hypothetical protein BSM4216_3434 [Bacillus smithii]|nr:hypothetical protein BSM4216_3434 [Bacillus smithii]